MPERSAFTPGEPCWIDLVSADRERSRAFYESVFGWRLSEGHATASPYLIARQAGRTVAGISTAADGGPPPGWTVYFCCADAGAVADRVRRLGGEIITSPVAEADDGAVTVFRDPFGAVAGGWQPGRVTGVQLAGEPGSLLGAELRVGDAVAAREFYEGAFHAAISGAVRSAVGGPVGWLPVLRIGARADFLAKVEAAGGSVEPDGPTGSESVSVVVDSTGARFAAAVDP